MAKRRFGKYLMGIGIAAGTLSVAAHADPVARFDFVEYRATGEETALSENEYANPVVPGFHPDPSIVRVGDDFYLVNSTFSWYPGLPILHSTDLVNWRLIGNAIDRPGMVDFSGLGTNRGLFAPAITHHDGRFWIVNTCIECRGNFVITAERPEGPWSDPVWLDFGGIDPSLYFAENGEAWIVYNDAPKGPPRYEGHRALWMKRFDPVSMQVQGEPILLVDGGVDPAEQPVWAEGPHIYKVGDWYYLLAAEGGTAEDHSQTVYRSKTVTGPYEPGPVNPILTQRDLPADRPDRVEATGHADLVELDDGSWWGVFLATRPFAGQSTLLGRETFLLPVEWRDGWPLFLDQGASVPLVGQKPGLVASENDPWDRWRDDFDGPLSADWIGIRTPQAVQRMMVGDGELTLIGGADAAGSLGKPAFVGRRLRHHDAEVITQLSFDPAGEGDFAGLLAFMDESHFVAFGREGDRLTVRMRQSADQGDRGEVVGSRPITQDGDIQLRIRLNGGSADFAWRPEGSGDWQAVAEQVNVEPLASVHAGLFTGVVIGPYAVSGS
tara:strand:- start:94789 stop:96444 length:1656 start_codon:yes stop_codon:yes gene_type:complete